MLEFDKSNDMEYKVKTICNSVVYAKEIDRHLLRLYYLVVWKGYSKKKHLETFFGSHTLLEDSQHLPQGPFREVNNNISASRLRFAHG